MIKIKRATMLFYDSEAEEYAKDRGDTSKALYDFERDTILHELLSTRPKLMLDVGCGWGRYIQYTRAFAEIVGIDFSRGMLVTGKKRLRKSGNVFFARGDAEQLPLRDNTFDVVYAVRSTKYLPNPQQAIREAYRVLKNNGIFVCFEISNKCRPEYGILAFLERLRKISDRLLDRESHRRGGFSFVVSAFALRKYLMEAGFKRIFLKGIFFLPSIFYKSVVFSQIRHSRAFEVLNWVECLFRRTPSLAVFADGILYEARK